MTWTIRWSKPAERTLRGLPWQDAAKIDAAVMRFATVMEGEVRGRPASNLVTVRLRVDGYSIRLSADRTTGILWVLWLFQRSG